MSIDFLFYFKLFCRKGIPHAFSFLRLYLQWLQPRIYQTKYSLILLLPLILILIVATQVAQVLVHLLEYKAITSNPFWEQTSKTVFKTQGSEFLIHISMAAPADIGEAASVLEMKERFRKQACCSWSL